jgi:PAS domain S-box-containing protein
MRSDKSITETHDFLLSLIGSVPNGIIAIDLEGYVTIANTQAIRILGLGMSVNELVEQEILNVLHEIEELRDTIHNCLAKGRRAFDLEEVHFKNKYLACRGRKIIDGLIITVSDITSIKESEINALNSMLQGQEQERKRLAQEIHDGVGPVLSTIKMSLANIEGAFESTDQQLSAQFRKSYQMIDEVASDIRAISHNLLPKVLIDFGLSEALQTICEKVEDARQLKVDFINTGFDERLSEDAELGLYRVCQELMNNTLKYAEASKITVQLIKRQELIILMYEDDGKGFYPDAVSEGIGMMNIHHRIKALAGEVVIDSQPGRGMTATIHIPINRE